MIDRRIWTQQEDSLLKALVQKHGTHSWTKITKDLLLIKPDFFKSGKQCRERWFNHLDGQISREEWTEEQERHFLEIRQSMGNRWTCEFQLKRSQNALKNFFYSKMRKGIKLVNQYLREHKARNLTLCNIKSLASTHPFLQKCRFLTSFLKTDSRHIRSMLTSSRFEQLVKSYSQTKLSKKQKGEDKEECNKQSLRELARRLDRDKISTLFWESVVIGCL